MNQFINAFNAQLEMVKGGQVRLPANITGAIEASVENTRANWTSASGVMWNLADAQLTAAKVLVEHVHRSASENVDAMADAVLSLAKARTPADVQKIQMDFASNQFGRYMKQTNAMIELTANAYNDAVRTLNSTLPKMG